MQLNRFSLASGDSMVADFALRGFLRTANAVDDSPPIVSTVFEGPVLLGHQPHFSTATELFAVVVKDFNQGVEGHVWFSVWVNGNWLCDDTMEQCDLNQFKPISADFGLVSSCFFVCPTLARVAFF
jgi:hypothetical protein